ncbi:MAG TPA: 2-phosphosulfolactate phosphatase [Chthonomonadaceae bacterium]|nr:2-phosphosulfolactate phosphatase [Chthonomonadaceae bacterium]
MDAIEISLEWGHRGAKRAAARGDVVVICDVLSFSTAVVIAVDRGATVFPCADEVEARVVSAKHGATIAVRREEAAERGGLSLSPASMLSCVQGERIALPSPNGAACCRLATGAAGVIVGALVNATEAARAAAALAGRLRRGLAIIACGERWTDAHADGALRFALEDYLGAGAVLSALDRSVAPSGVACREVASFAGDSQPCAPLTPDAAVCRDAFRASAGRIEALLRDCPSGRVLRDRGWPQDVELAAEVDCCRAVPILMDGAPVRAATDSSPRT